jgi:uncharacterized membrane protein YgdD (TMEM256/DUF423 family)
MNKRIVIRGLSLLFIAIILGAFGAHKLKVVLSVSELASFNTGVRYQMYGAFFLLILGINSSKFPFSIKLPAAIFFIGVGLFSTSIYLLTVMNIESLTKILGPITPVGGLLMIIGVGIILFKLLFSSEKINY